MCVSRALELSIKLLVDTASLDNIQDFAQVFNVVCRAFR